MNGLKRHLLTDTLGLPFSLSTTPANTSDRVAGAQLLRRAARECERVTTVVADQGYTGQIMRDACAETGLHLTLTKRPTGREGEAFVLMPRRWVIERTFAWISRSRRLDRSRERRPYVHAGFCYLALIRLVAGQLC